MAKKTRKKVRKATQRKQVRVRTRVQLNKLIGQRIRETRLRRNIRLRELSDSVGLTTSQLSQVELGKNAASIWALVRIANALGVRVTVFLSDV
jgi:DNA-binding Xre family transcriptional regulator